MFIPAEAFFAAAIESDPDIFEQALRQHVLISTPTTLIALIKAISYGWQQEKLAENAQEVAGLARELFDRIKVFGEHMGGLGRSLRQAVERYNQGVGSLEQRVLPVARRFENLGVILPGSTIAELVPVEVEPRELVAPELTALPAAQLGPP
jgi:DNA recombination protein RmuC